MFETCALAECRKAPIQWGFCAAHFAKIRRYSDPRGGRPETTEARFFSSVDPLTSDPLGCWRWVGSKTEDGYGRFRLSSGRQEVRAMAHRWIYELLRAPIPAGLQIDHLCRTPECVNPWHMEPVTSRVNALRSDGAAAINARKTHCPRGHEYTQSNTKRGRGRAGRQCRQCRRDRSAKRAGAL